MASDRFHSITSASDTDGGTTTCVYHGSRAEMEALAAEHVIDEADDYGWLKSIRVYHREGAVWECELKYEAPDDWESVAAPSREWGKRSCQLRGSTLSRPLETHPDYRTKWNHCLCAAPGTTALPAWYTQADDTLIPAADADKYCWCRTPYEAPYGDDGRWTMLAAPVKPGVDSYELAAYTVVETARFRSAEQAGRMVAGSLNRIGSPANTFGISGGSWKCGDAAVSWNGKCWIARLTWTRSENDDWDADLYGSDN